MTVKKCLWITTEVVANVCNTCIYLIYAAGRKAVTLLSTRMGSILLPLFYIWIQLYTHEILGTNINQTCIVNNNDYKFATVYQSEERLTWWGTKFNTNTYSGSNYNALIH